MSSFFAGLKAARAKTPSVPQPRKKAPPADDDDERRALIRDLNERRIAQDEAFEALVRLVRKHMGRKLDEEIEAIRGRR